MSASFGKQLRFAVIAAGLAKSSDLAGCSEADIEAIQLGQNVNFIPEVYRQFLLEMGYNAGWFWRGSDFTCDTVPQFKDGVNLQLENEERSFRIPGDAIVFLGHQGTVFYYFHTAEKDDDPPVYMFGDDVEEPVQLNSHLSEFFLQSVDEFTSMK